MKTLGRRPYHCVELGIEGDYGDRIQVSGAPLPAPRGSCPGVLVERMASLQNGAVLTGMSLCRADVADVAVAVSVVVPLHKRARPRARLIEIREALSSELWPVLYGAEQRLEARTSSSISSAATSSDGCSRSTNL